MLWKILKQNFVFQRAIITFIASLDLIGLMLHLQSKDIDHFFISFYVVRLLFYVVAYIFSIVRLSPKFYVPGFRFMPKDVYWTYVSFIYFTMKAIVLYKFIEISPFQRFFESSYVILVLGSILMSFQSQPWSTQENETRKRKINALAKQAKLTEKELNSIIPMLADKGKIAQEKPVIWILLEVILGVIFGAIISAYARDLVDLILNLSGIQLDNLLPPY